MLERNVRSGTKNQLIGVTRMVETKCKKFDECIQPHICGPSTACIWGQDDADSVGTKQLLRVEDETQKVTP